MPSIPTIQSVHEDVAEAEAEAEGEKEEEQAEEESSETESVEVSEDSQDIKEKRLLKKEILGELAHDI